MNRKPVVAVVGAGSLASFLVPALATAGYCITEIITRTRPQSRTRASGLAGKVGARVATMDNAALNGDLLWFCVPDGEIRKTAAALAKRGSSKIRFAFHSSGALLSKELDDLRRTGVAVASVHPLMTFVSGPHPSLEGVPFALEGDAAATNLARRIVRDLRGESFRLPSRRKAAYHAWATMTSPLLVAYLVTLEEAAREAGLGPKDGRRMSLPIIRQTLENYRSRGPEHSFSGPFMRGDVATVAKHLALLKKHPRTRAVYVALAHAALARLPVKNRRRLTRMLTLST